MKTQYGIDIHPGECGLSFSGGADSAVLLYILLSNMTDTLHLYSFYSEKKAHIAEPITDRVLNKCIELTGNQNVVHHKEYIKEQTPMLVHNMLQSYILRDGLSKMYNGISKFPPDDVIDLFQEDIRSDDEYVYQRRKNAAVYTLYFGERLAFYRPLANMDKKNVADLYRQLGIETQLYPLTRSCETVSSPEQHCGRCFWCEERHWGFGYLE
jgi:7-cyano-7-deazaguanine synthase in queuosine biosynthesis